MSEKYIFILGNNPELSVAEINAIYPEIEIIQKTGIFLIGELKDFDCEKAIDTLGGTIKIGRVINNEIDKKLAIKEIISKKQESKVKYGFSFYETKATEIGMEIKKELKKMGISSRLVVGKEKALSAVIVKKNKVVDFIILPNAFAITCAVQKFEEYGKRDYGRPKSDGKSGMIPPKLARMMINLSGTKKDDVVLDPFCGSGTMLMELMALGYNNLIGSDLSKKAVEDSKENTNWLKEEMRINDLNIKIESIDARNISKNIKANSIGAIITEPYLGPPMRGDENEKTITQIILEVENLYQKSFEEFKKILETGGIVVIVVPSWHLEKILNLDINSTITNLGFKRIDKKNLIYKRKKQKVWRHIEIWQKK